MEFKCVCLCGLSNPKDKQESSPPLFTCCSTVPSPIGKETSPARQARFALIRRLVFAQGMTLLLFYVLCTVAYTILITSRYRAVPSVFVDAAVLLLVTASNLTALVSVGNYCVWNWRCRDKILSGLDAATQITDEDRMALEIKELLQSRRPGTVRIMPNAFWNMVDVDT